MSSINFVITEEIVLARLAHPRDKVLLKAFLRAKARLVVPLGITGGATSYGNGRSTITTEHSGQELLNGNVFLIRFHMYIIPQSKHFVQYKIDKSSNRKSWILLELCRSRRRSLGFCQALTT
jgi:hypothetical protein